MKRLEEIRDRLAREFAEQKFPVQSIETRKDFTQDVNFARRMTHNQAFQDGFSAALKELMPMIEELEKALDECRDEIMGCAGHRTTYSVDNSKRALAAWRKFKEEE